MATAANIASVGAVGGRSIVRRCLRLTAGYAELARRRSLWYSRARASIIVCLGHNAAAFATVALLTPDR